MKADGAKGVLLVVLVVVGSCTASVLGPLENMGGREHSSRDLESEESQPDQPKDLMEFGRMMMTAMQSLLANQERAIDARLKQLELHVDNTCGSRPIPEGTLTAGVEGKVSNLLQEFANYMSSMAHDFIDKLQHNFDTKIEEAVEEIKDHTLQMNEKTVKTNGQMTKGNHLSDATVTAISKAIQNQVKHLAGKSDLQKQTEHLDKQLMKIESTNEGSLDSKILNYTKEIHHILYAFKPVYETFRKVVDNCKIQESHQNQMDRFGKLLQELKLEVDENGDVLSSIFETLEGAEDVMNENPTATSPNDTPLTPTPGASSVIHTSSLKKGQLSECEDSEFLGSIVDVCSAAVRHDKCHHGVVAYHCCRSCTDAGLLPKVGPHRYLNLPRKVVLFKSLK